MNGSSASRAETIRCEIFIAYSRIAALIASLWSENALATMQSLYEWLHAFFFHLATIQPSKGADNWYTDQTKLFDCRLGHQSFGTACSFLRCFNVRRYSTTSICIVQNHFCSCSWASQVLHPPASTITTPYPPHRNKNLLRGFQWPDGLSRPGTRSSVRKSGIPAPLVF